MSSTPLRMGFLSSLVDIHFPGVSGLLWVSASLIAGESLSATVTSSLGADTALLLDGTDTTTPYKSDRAFSGAQDSFGAVGSSQGQNYFVFRFSGNQAVVKLDYNLTSGSGLFVLGALLSPPAPTFQSGVMTWVTQPLPPPSPGPSINPKLVFPGPGIICNNTVTAANLGMTATGKKVLTYSANPPEAVPSSFNLTYLRATGQTNSPKVILS